MKLSEAARAREAAQRLCIVIEGYGNSGNGWGRAKDAIKEVRHVLVAQETEKAPA